LATNGIDAGVKIRPTESELATMRSWPTPDFQRGWDSYFKNKPDKPVMHYSVISGYLSSISTLSHRSLTRTVDGLETTCSCHRGNSSPCFTSW
jgi:hypothetical protein